MKTIICDKKRVEAYSIAYSLVAKPLTAAEQGYSVIVGGESIGTIETYHNPFHGRNCYLKMELQKYPDEIAIDLFAELRRKIGSPLQVMTPSTDATLVSFLIAGGFVRKRSCFEMEVTRGDLRVPLEACVPLQVLEKGSPEYEACARLLYEQYARSHEAISPLTADLSQFCTQLPDKVVCENGNIQRFAFIEDNEIAYVGASKLTSFRAFALSLLDFLFGKYPEICFEADDCDAAAMALRALFAMENVESYDTYILK